MLPFPNIRRLITAIAASVAALLALSTAGCSLIADGHNKQGVRDFQTGNYAGAMQRFQQAAQVDPRNADAIYNMAATHHRHGIQTSNRELLNQAEILYNQALDVSPNHADAYRGLAVLLVQTDRPDKAFRLLRNWAATSPQSVDPHIELARLEQEFGNIEATKTHLSDALLLDQNNPRVNAAWAYVHEREGNYSQAVSNYQKSLSFRQNPAVASRIQNLNQVMASGSGGQTNGTRTVRANDQGWTARY